MHNDISITVNQDDNIAGQVIERHAEGKGVREIVRTLKKATSTISRILKQNGDRTVSETSTEQRTENPELQESTTKQRKSNIASFHG